MIGNGWVVMSLYKNHSYFLTFIHENITNKSNDEDYTVFDCVQGNDYAASGHITWHILNGG